MENAVDALKIAFGILVFIIALTILFNISSLARYTSESLIVEADKTTYYNYYENNNQLVDDQGNRIVTLQDMIPTIYRYWSESYGVTIIDNNTIVARFDMQTERACHSFGTMTDSQKNLIMNEINDYVLRPVGCEPLVRNNLRDDLQELFARIYAQDPTPLYHPRTFDCQWCANNSASATLVSRIDSDLSRSKSLF